MNAEPAAERSGVVLAAAAGIALLVGLVVVLATQTTRAADPRATLEAWFELGELPDGLEPVEAQVLARGDVTARLERLDAGTEADRKESPDGEPEEEREPFDWSTVPVGEAGTAPREVLVAELPLEHAPSELQQLFTEGVELAGDWKAVPRSGGRRILERGQLDWGELAAPYVLEREFEAGGTFRDTLRVNLSRGQTPLVLFARWNRGFPASRERVQALLAALRPR